MRPVLAPSLRPVWRGPQTLQLGRPTGRSAILTGVDQPLRATLDLLDGTRDSAAVVSAAAAAGCAPRRAAALLHVLDEAGLLDDAAQERSALLPLTRQERERLSADVASLALVRGDGGLVALDHRRSASVLVAGAGRVGMAVALTLATAGVGAVDVVDDGLTRPEDTGVGALDLRDVGRSREEAAREHLLAAAPSLAGGRLEQPDLVVLAPMRGDEPERARRLVLDGTAHLVAEVRDTTGIVGPLVLPGRSPCLRCLDLTRTDLDPTWPAVAAQLASATVSREACDGPLAVAVAAQAAMQVLALLDGTADPAALAGTLELALPDWRWRRRSWPVHPECGCSASG